MQYLPARIVSREALDEKTMNLGLNHLYVNSLHCFSLSIYLPYHCDATEVKLLDSLNFFNSNYGSSFN